jgi:hypothetical protein
MSRPRLIYSAAVEAVGRVRVVFNPEYQEFCARLVGCTGDLLGEYHTDDRDDALATADYMLSHHAKAQGLG